MQIKEGPIDFQVREPVSPLIGALKRTNETLEFQVTQEYTGQQHQLCFLLPMWKEVLDTDLHADGRTTLVKDIVSGKTFGRPRGGLVAVTNVGLDQNWLGLDLAMANLYGFGRIAWNPDLTSREIVDEWTRMTFSHDAHVVDTTDDLELRSWRAYENYTGPLGAGGLTDIIGVHYGPGIESSERNGWGQWHRADEKGIGMDRTVATGTGYIGQYSPPVAQVYESLATCPDNLLLFMHHVPYTHVLHSGKTVIQHIYDSHYDGAAEAQRFPEKWRLLHGLVDEERWTAVLKKLQYQAAYAEVWRDDVNDWFHKTSGIPDAHGRVGHHPGRWEAESMSLEGYAVEGITPWEGASDGKAVACPTREVFSHDSLRRAAGFVQRRRSILRSEQRCCSFSDFRRRSDVRSMGGRRQAAYPESQRSHQHSPHGRRCCAAPWRSNSNYRISRRRRASSSRLPRSKTFSSCKLLTVYPRIPMTAIAKEKQTALVDRLTQACGGGYSPEVRRRYFITGPQWAPAYEGQAVFHAPVRSPLTFETVIEEYSKVGVGYWCTHDTDVIPTDDLFTPRQDEIVERIKQSLAKHGVKCSMVTTETFHHAVWAAGPAAEAPEVREYAKRRAVEHSDIGHELGAQYCVYWPGSLGYYMQGVVEETQTLRWFAEGLNAACEARYRDGEEEEPADTEALHGGEAVRAAGGDPAADLRCDAGVHLFRAAEASGDGRAEPGVPARIDVGRRVARGTGAGAAYAASCSTSTSMTATV